MLTLDAQNEKIKIEAKQTVGVVVLNEAHYDFIASEISSGYSDHMLERLTLDNGVVDAEIDFDDKSRYSKENRSKLLAGRRIEANPAVINEYSKPREKTVRTFDHKKTSILVMYIAMVFVVVIALILTVPGTAWEKDGVDINYGTNVAMAVESNPNANQGLNVMLTENGPVAVELTPYEEVDEAPTNWFDKLCDWVSNIVGG